MDSIIGLTLNRLLIFLLLGVFASMCQEAVAGYCGARAIYLARGLKSLLGRSELSDGTLLIERIYNHGLVHSLYIDSGRRRYESTFVRNLLGLPPLEHTEGLVNTESLPSYIPSHVFAMTLIDLLNTDKLNGKVPLVNIEAEIFALRTLARSKDTSRLAESLLSMLVDAANKDDASFAFQQSLESWFNSTMDQASAWYKKFAERSLLIIGLLFAFIFNVDAIHVAQVQSWNADVNQTLQSAQDSYLKAYFKANPATQHEGQFSFGKDLMNIEKFAIETRLEASSKLTTAYGWQWSLNDYKYMLVNPGTWEIARLLNHAAGWLITAYAASLFARLWFDFSAKIAPRWTTRNGREVKPSDR